MSKAIEKLAEAATAARAKLLEVRSRRADTERRLEGLRAEREQAEQDAAATALVPGGGTAVATAPTTDLDAEIGRLAAEEREAERAVEEAEAAYQEAVLAAVPRQAEAVADALEEYRAALAELGEAALERYHTVAHARDEYREGRRDLERLSSQLKGVPSLVGRQRRELRRWIKGELTDPTPEEVAGLFVARMLGWTRRDSSGLADYWRGRGISLFEGSVLQPGNPPPVIDDDIMKLRAGRLPL